MRRSALTPKTGKTPVSQPVNAVAQMFPGFPLQRTNAEGKKEFPTTAQILTSFHEFLRHINAVDEVNMPLDELKSFFAEHDIDLDLSPWQSKDKPRSEEKTLDRDALEKLRRGLTSSTSFTSPGKSPKGSMKYVPPAASKSMDKDTLDLVVLTHLANQKTTLQAYKDLFPPSYLTENFDKHFWIKDAAEVKNILKIAYRDFVFQTVLSCDPPALEKATAKTSTRKSSTGKTLDFDKVADGDDSQSDSTDDSDEPEIVLPKKSKAKTPTGRSTRSSAGAKKASKSASK